MTRTVTIVGGVITTLAVVVVLALTVLSQGGSTPAAAPSVGASTSPGGSRCTVPPTGADGLAWVCLSDLPVQARRTVALIDAGGPFPYGKDGATFNNFEGELPTKPRGYYREYTVPTPGENDRGARRMVTGDRDRELFYTADHYASFVRVQR